MPFSVNYSFTLTLRPKCYIHEPERQYDDTYEYIRRKLSSLSQAFTIIAEVTKSYNVHYHGLISFYYNDNIKLVNNNINQRDFIKEFHKCFRNDTFVGYIKIDQMRDENNWKAYLKKDLEHTMNAINRRPLIWDFFDWFDSEERAIYGITW